jgi:alkylation response protein AidB-like acyl-CoA dehydrogenase
MIKAAAREFLEKECPKDLVRQIENDEKTYSPELWRKMAELNWQGLIFPAEYVPIEEGGSGGNFLDLIILMEEIGRALAPVPFLETVILGGLSVLYGGNEEQKRALLNEIARGELLFSMGHTERDWFYDTGRFSTIAVREEDRFRINGSKIFVPFGNVSDFLICVCRTTNTSGKDVGISLFLIDSRRQGVEWNVLRTIASNNQCEAIFRDVLVPSNSLIGQYNKGCQTLRAVLERATAAQCAQMVGGAEKVLEIAVSHAKKRVQFNKVIGSFQAVQHRLADMLVDLDGAKLATYEAAWRLSRMEDSTREVSLAKMWVNQAYRRVCAGAHQVIGGEGVMREHDMQLYTRRAKLGEFLYGDTKYHREIVARQLGL